MKKLLLLGLTIILLLTLTACSGYNGIMREHLNNEANYHDIEATFCSYKEAGDRIYLYVSVENKSAFDSSEANSEEIRLELVGDNCNVLSEAFAKEVEGMKTAEDLQAALKQHGIEMTIDEIVELGGQLAHQMGMGKDGELSEDDLENVSGGGLFGLVVSGVTFFIVSIYMGTQGCKI